MPTAAAEPRRVIQTLRVFYCAYLILWSLTALPVFALGLGMFGATVADGQWVLLEGAITMEPIALGMVLASLPMLGLPYWTRREAARR